MMEMALFSLILIDASEILILSFQLDEIIGLLIQLTFLVLQNFLQFQNDVLVQFFWLRKLLLVGSHAQVFLLFFFVCQIVLEESVKILLLQMFLSIPSALMLFLLMKLLTLFILQQFSETLIQEKFFLLMRKKTLQSGVFYCPLSAKNL